MNSVLLATGWISLGYACLNSMVVLTTIVDDTTRMSHYELALYEQSLRSDYNNMIRGITVAISAFALEFLLNNYKSFC